MVGVVVVDDVEVVGGRVVELVVVVEGVGFGVVLWVVGVVLSWVVGVGVLSVVGTVVVGVTL